MPQPHGHAECEKRDCGADHFAGSCALSWRERRGHPGLPHSSFAYLESGISLKTSSSLHFGHPSTAPSVLTFPLICSSADSAAMARASKLTIAPFISANNLPHVRSDIPDAFHPIFSITTASPGNASNGCGVRPSSLTGDAVVMALNATCWPSPSPARYTAAHRRSVFQNRRNTGSANIPGHWLW